MRLRDLKEVIIVALALVVYFVVAVCDVLKRFFKHIGDKLLDIAYR